LLKETKKTFGVGTQGSMIVGQRETYLFRDVTYKKFKSKTSHFFKSKPEDFPNLWRVWTALWFYRSANNYRAKSTPLLWLFGCLWFNKPRDWLCCGKWI